MKVTNNQLRNATFTEIENWISQGLTVRGKKVVAVRGAWGLPNLVFSCGLSLGVWELRKSDEIE